MKIKELKSFNKPIEKLIYNGPNSLSNDELLAILINTGTKNESCIDIAKRILNSITNLSNLTDITVNQLIKFKGIKEKKAALIVAAFELVKRCNESYNLGETIERKEERITIYIEQYMLCIFFFLWD